MELPETAPVLPRWLAGLHRRSPVGHVVELPTSVAAVVDRLADDRGAPTWPDLIVGGGFADLDPGGPRAGRRLRRLDSLPDDVGPGLRALVIGLNPSPAAAAAGVGFARPGNRFWPAARAAGLVTCDRDPDHAFTVDGVGFTDLAKRTTRRAAELDPAELRHGLARVEGIVGWLRPAVSVMVGLMGWRTAVDRRAAAGWQEGGLGDRPLYLMPSTSGLNAGSSLADLTDHLRRCAEAGRSR